jgi:hypothetical protein
MLIPELHDARTALEDISRRLGDTFIADGRLCTLMPFCDLLVAPRDLQALLVLEDPATAIGRLERLGLGLGHAQALWERSLRNAVLGLEGTPTEVSLAGATGGSAEGADPPARSLELWEVAVGLTGQHAALPAIDVPDETSTTAIELEELRRYWSVGLLGVRTGDTADSLGHDVG